MYRLRNHQLCRLTGIVLSIVLFQQSLMISVFVSGSTLSGKETTGSCVVEFVEWICDTDIDHYPITSDLPGQTGTEEERAESDKHDAKILMDSDFLNSSSLRNTSVLHYDCRISTAFCRLFSPPPEA